jgi:hypothetical protein
MADFTEILSKKVTEIEKPKPRPAGTYLAQTVGIPSQVTQQTKNGEMNKLVFKCKLLQAQTDVDTDALDEQGDMSQWPPMNHDVIVNEDNLWGLRRFLTEVLDIDGGTEANPKTLGEMLADSGGRNLMVSIQHEPYTDRDGQPAIAARIKGTAKA